MTDYYVDGAVGDDANAGTSEGAGNAWATIGRAQSAPVAINDRIFVKASATYSETLTFTSTTYTGNNQNNPVFLIGYADTPGDNGQVIWEPETTGACLLLASASGYLFKNFIFQNSNTTAVGSNGSTTVSTVIFINCVFRNNAGYGVAFGFSGNTTRFVKCEIYGNNRDGLFSLGMQGEGLKVYDNCASDSSTDEECFITGIMYRSFISSLPGLVQTTPATMDFQGTNSGLQACTFFGNGGDPANSNVRVATTLGQSFTYDCVLRGGETYGLVLQSSGEWDQVYYGHNVIYDYGSAAYNIANPFPQIGAIFDQDTYVNPGISPTTGYVQSEGAAANTLGIMPGGYT